MLPIVCTSGILPSILQVVLGGVAKQESKRHAICHLFDGRDILALSVDKVSDCDISHIYRAVVCFILYALGDSNNVGACLYEGLVVASLE